MVAEARVTGLPEMKAALLAIPAKLRRRALRLALAAGARVVRDEARRVAPVLTPANAELAAPYRKPGTVRKAIVVRTSKIDRRQGDVGVFVNVRPAKRGQRGSKSPDDPFYWRFLEFGWNPASQRTGGTGRAGARQRRALNKSTDTKIRTGWRFLQEGAKKLPQALQVFIAKIGPAIDKLDKGQMP